MTTNTVSSERQSNIELLRIVLIFMIIVHHLIVHNCGIEYISSGSFEFGVKTPFELLINSFVVIGVNSFIFISGYFGIKFKMNTLVSFLLEALFYSVTIYLIFALCGLTELKPFAFIKSLFPLSRNTWWFLTTYIALYIISPILNKGIEALDKKQLLFSVVGLLFFNCFSGFIVGTLSGNGRTLFNLISIYVLARYMNKYVHNLHYPFLSYGFFSMILFGSVLLCVKFNKLSMAWHIMYSLNNPFMVLSSVFIFYGFKNIRLNSRMINIISSLVLGIYLISDHPYVRDLITEKINLLRSCSDDTTFVILLCAIASSIFTIGACIEKCRQVLFRPLIGGIMKIKYIQQLDIIWK